MNKKHLAKITWFSEDEGGTEWYEIIVNDLEQFFKYYSEGGVLNDFAVIDLENRIVFEIEQMEKNLDYYIKRL